MEEIKTTYTGCASPSGSAASQSAGAHRSISISASAITPKALLFMSMPP